MSLTTRFHHTGILTEDLERIKRVFGDVLGAQIAEPKREMDLGADFMWVEVGGVTLEFIAPTSANSRAAQLIRERGAGVHHVALSVDDVDAALLAVRAAGIATVDVAARAGAGGMRIGFIEPTQTAGTLIELVQPAGPNRQTTPEVR